MARISICLSLCMLAGVVAAQDRTAAPRESNTAAGTRESAEFFETSVRPLLVQHCCSCHGPETQEAGLRLDSAAGFQKGGDSGPLVEAAEPLDSRILRVIRYADEPKMPPTGMLADHEIKMLTQWVISGAHWPAESLVTEGTHRATVAEVASSHWAFQPVVAPPVPTGPWREPNAWTQSPIDRFLLSRLMTAGLTPSPPADRRTLIRRATYDLHGLPPSPEETADFEQDSAPDAFERLVDRLLASPRYGERWGRHWLDVARYSDTKGYVRLKDNPAYPAAWTYRDYVIRAFNEDIPYDQFVLEQLAADQLQPDDDPRKLAAMGFLTLGQRFINSQNDIIDDRIDVVTRGMLGLTVSCARCHDHKFDPIPTRDYYSLHGVFASSVEPDVPPLIVPLRDREQYAAYCDELQRRTTAFEQFLVSRQQSFEAAFRSQAGAYLLAGQSEKVQANFLATMFLIDASKDLNPVMTQRWARLLERTRHIHHPILTPWHQFAKLQSSVGADEFSAAASQLLQSWHAQHDSGLNPLLIAALSESPLQDLQDVASRYGTLLNEADSRWHDLLRMQPDAKQLADPAWEQLRQLQYGPEAPPVVALSDVPEFLFVDATTQNQFHDQQRLVEDWIASPEAAPHAHVLYDADEPVVPRVFLRGNASNPGEAVPRQFLEVLGGGERRPFANGSGRLELARAIADRKNPLTARVLVNRVWLWHFGSGLVRTPGDFGLRGEKPAHPELLDYLAWHFMEEGWSIKSLHKTLMLSAVYQQQNKMVDSGHAVDPENQLWWRMNRRRLDWESLHDSLLAVSGQLDLTMGRQSIDLLTPPWSARRAVYGRIDRQNLPNLLRMFDFVAPDATSPQRHQTTVPQQALFLMNSEFLKDQAIHLATRLDHAVPDSESQKIQMAYQLLFARNAEPGEIELGIRYLQHPEQLGSASSEVEENATSKNSLSRWQEYLQALLLTNEFTFVD